MQISNTLRYISSREVIFSPLLVNLFLFLLRWGTYVDISGKYEKQVPIGSTVGYEMMKYKVILVGTEWYWVSKGWYWLVFDGTRSV